MLCGDISFCPTQDHFTQFITVNSEVFKHEGKICCFSDKDIESFSMQYSGNAVGEVMYVEVTLWGPQHHICESSHGNLILTYVMPSGKIDTMEMIRDPLYSNVFLWGH